MDVQTEPDTIQFEDVDITDPKYLTNTFSQRRSSLFVIIADANIALLDIEKMMETGMNVARFKTSHCTRGDRVKLIHKVDTAGTFLARKYGLLEWPCCTCIELKTSVVQTGLLEEDVPEITIKPNTELVLTYNIAEYNKCNEQRIFVDNPYLIADVKVGMELNISQDEIIMKCTAILDERSIKCLVTKGGQLQNMAYLCMRGAKRTRPSTTKQDLRLVKFAVEYQVDMIIINYVRHIDTVKRIKQYLGQKTKRPMIIGGLCTEQGFNSLDEILTEADGILLSREFFAYEVDSIYYNRLDQIQKVIAAKCLLAGKPFYLSGEIFSEALVSGNFTIREMSDVTNAILSGTSGFVIQESPNTDNLIEVMKMMNETCAAVEPLSNNKTEFMTTLAQIKMPMNAAETAAISCALIANQTNARCIVLPTVTGRTAYILNWLRPISIVMAVSTKIRTIRRLFVYRSVKPLLYKGAPRKTWYGTVQARIHFAIQHAVEKHWILYGDHYVTLEKSTEESSFCDTVRVWNVTAIKKNTIECPESYHDFCIDTFEPKQQNVSNKKSDLDTKVKTEVKEKRKKKKEKENEKLEEKQENTTQKEEHREKKKEIEKEKHEEKEENITQKEEHRKNEKHSNIEMEQDREENEEEGEKEKDNKDSENK